MERRPLQTELPLTPPRSRVALADAAAVTPRIAGPDLSRAPGEPLMATIMRREDHKRGEDLERTAWFTGAPGCSGFYEVRQKAARLTTNHVRVWYDAVTDAWWFGNGDGKTVEPVTQFRLTLSHFWRGLKAPHPDGYPYRVRDQRVRLLEAA